MASAAQARRWRYLCTASLSIAFLFFLVVLIKGDPVLKAMRTDLTGAMVAGAVAMSSTAVISGCGSST